MDEVELNEKAVTGDDDSNRVNVMHRRMLHYFLVMKTKEQYSLSRTNYKELRSK